MKSIFLLLTMFLLTQCYSFTGGSIPEHIKTLYIMNIDDNSGSGNPLYREELSFRIIQKFRDDNSFSLVDSRGDANLRIVINAISDSPISLQAGEIEKERKVTVTCKVEYFDAVKQKQIFNKSFSNFSTYDLSNAQANRDEAVLKIMSQISDDILLAVVSGW